MENAKDVKIPYTFMLHVLDSKLDEIDNIKCPEMLEQRKLVDEKLGEIQSFWETNYKEIEKILKPELCKYLKREALKHLYTRELTTTPSGWNVTNIAKLYIEKDWSDGQYDELKKSVILEKRASEIFA
ncbi:MAG: hypothetical protein NT016_03525 [Candidatus Aenigmarchaeota archaeon]|nr:hypothetical protein [Candidatus Aenigmarchaeota archaeon]